MKIKFKKISFDASELLESRKHPDAEEIFARLESGDPAVFDALRQMGVPIAKVLLPVLEKKGHLDAIVSQFYGGFFSDKQIDQFLQRSGESLASLQNQLPKSKKSEVLVLLMAPKKQLTKEEITKSIIKYPQLVAKFFPIVYNLVQRLFSVSELIELALSSTKGHGIEEILKWIPLIQSYLDDNGVEKIITKMKGSTKKLLFSQDFFFAKYAGERIDYVSEEFAYQIISQFDKDNLFILTHSASTSKLRQIGETSGDRFSDLLSFLRDHEVGESGEIADCIKTTYNNLPCRKNDVQDSIYNEIIERKNNSKKGTIKIDGQPTFYVGTGNSQYLVALRTINSSDGSFSVIKKGIYVASDKLRKKLSNHFRQLPDDNDSPEINIDDDVQIVPVGFWDGGIEYKRAESDCLHDSSLIGTGQDWRNVAGKRSKWRNDRFRSLFNSLDS
ncbi:MAG: hypothetical protein HQ564_02730 [Candidatus Saganbacteria bacterium]|nr:hypothetical protein [Candidatus Saganbacteria bacterium]